MNSPVIEAVARATGRAVDSSVSLGASRQRPVCHETRCRPGADPAPCLRARRHVLLRDLHLANHGQLRPARRPPSRMGSSGWCSPTRPPLLPLLPSISTSVLRALQRAQKLSAKPRNRLGSSRFRLPQIDVPGRNYFPPTLIPACAVARALLHVAKNWPHSTADHQGITKYGCIYVIRCQDD